jgi:hypothetical protein
MKVYMAAFYHTAKTIAEGRSVHKRITAANYVYPWILESFYYFDNAMKQSMQQDKRDVFMDSGAFTAFTQGVSLDLRKYADFLKRDTDVYHIASNIDVIGRGKEQETYDNQKKLENLVGPNIVMPVHHVRDHDDWLRRYMDEGYDYIFLGGMVPESIPDLRLWLDHVWTKYLTNPDGTAKIKIHGFGLTTEELMFRYPWYSVDSTSWVLASGFGSCFIDLPRDNGTVTRIKVNFSEHSSSRYDIHGWHFRSMDKDSQDAIRQRLQQLEADRRWIANNQLRKDFKEETGEVLAYTPEALAKSYGLRRVLNMDYYLRMDDAHTSTFRHMQETLF